MHCFSSNHWLVKRLTPCVLLALSFANLASVAEDNAQSTTAFTENVRIQFQARLRKVSADDRANAIRELSKFRDLEAIKLIVHNGLRDRDTAVSAASMLAVREHRSELSIGRSLVEQLRAEVLGKRRYQMDFCKRLIEAITEYRFPELYSDLFRLAGECEPALAQVIGEIVMTAVDRLSDEPDAEATIALLERLSSTPAFGNSYGFRRCIIDAAMRQRNRESVAFLVRQLRPLEGELRHLIVRHLRQISKQDLSDESAVWERWWQNAKGTFVFPPAEMRASMASAEPGTPRYYDLPIHAKRMVFILDTSKSMAASDMITRLEAAKRELIKTIDQLPSGVLFNIVVFNSSVSVWQDKLAPASESWKTHAKGFVQGQRPIGKTATYDALQAAYKLDTNVEVFYLLSDGAPSDGTIVQTEMLLEAIRKQNRIRRVAINTFGVFGGGDSEGLEPFMRRLAEENFGTFKRVN